MKESGMMRSSLPPILAGSLRSNGIATSIVFRQLMGDAASKDTSVWAGQDLGMPELPELNV